MSVIEFKRREREETHDPHMTGYAICAACHYEWLAVVPVGTTLLQCMECLTEKARMKYSGMPSSGRVWECACGCDVFRITDKAALCINCGVTQEFP